MLKPEDPFEAFYLAQSVYALGVPCACLATSLRDMRLAVSVHRLPKVVWRDISGIGTINITNTTCDAKHYGL